MSSVNDFLVTAGRDYELCISKSDLSQIEVEVIK